MTGGIQCAKLLGKSTMLFRGIPIVASRPKHAQQFALRKVLRIGVSEAFQSPGDACCRTETGLRVSSRTKGSGVLPSADIHSDPERKWRIRAAIPDDAQEMTAITQSCGLDWDEEQLKVHFDVTEAALITILELVIVRQYPIQVLLTSLKFVSASHTIQVECYRNIAAVSVALSNRRICAVLIAWLVANEVNTGLHSISMLLITMCAYSCWKHLCNSKVTGILAD